MNRGQNASVLPEKPNVDLLSDVRRNWGDESWTARKKFGSLQISHPAALPIGPASGAPTGRRVEVCGRANRFSILADNEFGEEFGETLEQLSSARGISMEGAARIRRWLSAFTVAVSCFFGVRPRALFRRDSLVQLIVECLVA